MAKVKVKEKETKQTNLTKQPKTMHQEKTALVTKEKMPSK